MIPVLLIFIKRRSELLPLSYGQIDYFLGIPKILRRASFFSFRFGVKANSHYVGGVNVFGKGFGDHNQDIIVQVHYKDEN